MLGVDLRTWYPMWLILSIAAGILFGYWSVTGTLLLLPTSIDSGWASLVGAFIGAATPVSLFLWDNNRKRQEKEREYFLYAEKSLITAINNLSDIDRTLHSFMDGNFAIYRRSVETDMRLNRPSVGQTFIPLSAVFTIDGEMLKGTTGSMFVENLLMQAISISRDLPILLQDMHRQFDRTMSFNTQIGLMGLNNPNIHNNTLLGNLDNFASFMNEQVFGNNIPVYLKILVSALAPLQERNRLGLKTWAKKYPYPSTMPVEERMKKMDANFKEEIDGRIDSLRGEFKSKLLLSDEMPMRSS